MLLFRLADVPRTVRRLTPPILASPDAMGPDADDATGQLEIGWTLRPTLLDPDSKRTRARIAQALALYAAAEGQPRPAVEALGVQIEEILGDYRLARCVARTIESLGYHFALPPRPLPQEPAALRLLCYRRAQERYHGYVPRDRRAAFLAALAAELGTTPELLEEALWADHPAAALLRAGAAPTEVAAEAAPAGVVSGAMHDHPPSAAPPTPARVIAHYNAAAVATLLAASSWVTLVLPATETAALKSLYRHAKARHVGVEIALQTATHHAVQGHAEQPAGLLTVMLYGPGSRALVRGRHVRPAEGSPTPRGTAGDGHMGIEPVEAVAVTARPPAGGDPPGTGTTGDDEAEHDGVAGGIAGDAGVSVPAPGGPPVAAVVMRLLQRHPEAVREGCMRLLGADQRLFHVHLDDDALDALRGAPDDRAEGEGPGAGQEAGADGYDSAVEATFARAFQAAEAGGRLGVARGWSVEREPRVIVVDGAVFLPDFSFRRGDVEVLCEVVGFYTEDYLARKKRKLARLHGQIPLLLVVDGERAPLFSSAGFPLVTYRAGHQISVTDVVQALDACFDPFARRREQATHTLADLCAAPGPRLSEEELCAAVGCAGRAELAALWSALLTQIPGGVSGGRADAVAGVTLPWPRRYVPGYGLAPTAAVAAAQEGLGHLLDAAADGVALQEAVRCCAQAGLPEPDEALIGALGGVVVRAGLFGEARVYRPGADAERALADALTMTPSGRRRRRP